MYDQILVPTDGSDGTRGAVENAIDLATTYDAALHTIFVVDTTVGIDASIPGTFDALEDAGENAIDEVIQQAEAAGVDTIEGVVAQGAPPPGHSRIRRRTRHRSRRDGDAWPHGSGSISRW